MRIRPLAVSFDLDGTLFDHHRASRHALEILCREAGIDFERFLPVFERRNQELWDDYAAGRIDSSGIRSRRFERTFADLGIDGPDPAEWGERYLEIYQGCPFPVDGAEETLRRLHGRMILAIVTNGYTSTQHRKLESTGLARFFDLVLTSEEVGEPKPAPGIFRRAAERLALDAGRILHVGDSLESDVAGARAAGFQAAWFRPDGTPEDAAGEDVMIVRRLGEIPDRIL